MLTTVVFIFLTKEVLTDYNVALNKNIINCNKKKAFQMLVDGDTNIDKAVRHIQNCTEYFSFEINLGAEHLIHYVVIYEGRASNKYGPLDEISVELDNNIIRSLCSNYNNIKPGTPHTKGIRINCFVGYAILVKVRVNNNEGFTISEVEVYTMASSIPKDDVTIYYGCFQSFNVNFLYTDGSTWKKCFMRCRSKGKLAAFSNNIENCYCGEVNNKTDSVSLDQCPACGTHFCGGNGTYSVYIVMYQLPYYLGCHELVETINSYYETNISGCLFRCSNYTYAALTRAIGCECIDSIELIERGNETDCNIPCVDDLTTICGGLYHASVYMIKVIGVMLNMIELMRCVGGFDQHGICIGGCDLGYIGDHCIEVIQNYCVVINPCTDLMNTECVAIDTTYTCQCLTGFEREKLSGPCFASPSASKVRSEGTARINEFCVKFDPCANISNSNCVDVNSSYECQCNDGFFESSEACEDIDECLYEFCDNESSTCVNMQGHFLCQCKDSFVRLNDFFCIKDDTESYGVRESVPNYIFFLILPVLVLFILCLVTLLFGEKIQRSLSSSASSLHSTA